MTTDPAVFEAPFIYMLNSTLDAVAAPPNASAEDIKTQQLAVAMALGALNPSDAIDTLSAARAITAHHAAMECYRRAAKPDVTDKMLATLLARAASLSRLTAQTIQAIELRKAVARDAKGRAKAARQAATQTGSQDPVPSEARQPQPPSAGATTPRDPWALDPRDPLLNPRRTTPPNAHPTAVARTGAQHPMPSENGPSKPSATPGIRSAIPAAG
jgi:hypothetical protein